MFNFYKSCIINLLVICLLGFYIQPAVANDNQNNLSWDLDLDGNVDALTDGLLMLRYTFGLRGNSLTASAISTESNLTSSEVESRVETILTIADIDGNGDVDALTDGLILLRYLFNLRNEPLISGAVSQNAIRSSSIAVSQYLIDHMPGIYTGGLPNALIINEAVSSNSLFDDEDGDSPDWFELYNNTSSTIDLSGWTITDDIELPSKWAFPGYLIAPGEYLRIWASDKDKALGGNYKTLVNQGDSFRYTIPSSNLSTSWNNLAFDDSSWNIGNSGFGYADGDDATQVPFGISSVFVRKVFTVNDLDLMDELWFDVDFDDGFVAYINGTEIARSNIIGESPSFDAVTVTDREARMYQSGEPIRFQVSNFQNILNNGDNVLSIQVHNHNAYSSDLTLIPFLTARYTGATADGVTPPIILGLQNSSLHTNFKISSNGETLILYNNGNQVGFLDVAGISNDNSVGRSLVDGSTVFYGSPSPGETNSNTSFTGIIESDIVFSHDGGEFNGQSISLSGNAEGEEIHYTLDATIPTESSPLYSAPIMISDNTVIRAKIFKPDHIPSEVESRTYIVNAEHSLPIVTLVSEPNNFFDQQQGIYEYGPDENIPEYVLPFFGANFWQDWERDVHFSFYEPTGELGVELDAGVKIFGAWSRANDQRSLAIYARGRYGTSKIRYPIFPKLDYDSFESIVLRSSGNDWMRTNIKDVIATSLMDGSGLETQAHRSAVVYINGEYWGLYNIREKVNEHFLDDKINVSKSQINILERNGEISRGTNEAYNQLLDFITYNNLSSQSNYEYVAEQIDIDNFITYQIAQIYMDNTDWPGNNVKFWNSPETKWRWILYDTDFAFGRPWEAPPFYTRDSLSFALDEFGPGWPNPPWSTFLARKLLENNDFKNKFINQLADELNGRFKPENVRQHIENIANSVAAEIPRHYAHWSNWDNRSPYWQNQFMLSSYGEWEAEVNLIKDFTDNRPPFIEEHFRNYFGIGGMFTLNLSINNTNAGKVLLNSLTIDTTNWQGEYFDFVPVTLTAVANEGYEFVRWQGAINQTAPNVTLTTASDANVEAIFQPIAN
jgi:hypothetical protein